MSDKVVEITLAGGEVVTFTNTEYHLEFPPANLYTGADGSQAFIVRSGTFSIKTAEFKGWQGAEGVTVDGNFYEVKRNFRYPTQEGEWLRYPVGP